MSNNIIECPICNFAFGNWRQNCPTCGTYKTTPHYQDFPLCANTTGILHVIKVAHGAERARQLPQSPRVFQLVD